jgi:hypothetical protein
MELVLKALFSPKCVKIMKNLCIIYIFICMVVVTTTPAASEGFAQLREA